jgi:cobalt-zinc-cadmium efflux system outer membrane protein
MWLRLAAFAALTLAPCVVVHAQAALPPGSSEVLTLDAAFDRVAQAHPDLRLFGPRGDVLRAEFDRASQRPAFTLGGELENVAGTGQASGVRFAEATFTLASVFERGGKLDARRTLAQSRIDALAMQRESARLDLLAEVARRYLAMAAAKRQGDIAAFDIGQRTRTVAGARQRLQAGASPESVVLTAQAALAKAELERARAAQAYRSARQHLAALWGERAPSFEVAGADPRVLPSIESATSLAELLERTPELQRFADEQRIGEARLQLARSEASADIGWSAGVRRFREGNDAGFLASVSIPLGQAARAQPGIRAAEAELAVLGIEREARGISLYSTLAEAHGQYTVAEVEVERLGSDVIPKLTRAEAAAERAYRAGAISYLEWAQLQSERTSARKQQLEAAIAAQRALIEIQRLTGQPLLAAPASDTDTKDIP